MEKITREELLRRKHDFSSLLVHFTKDEISGDTPPNEIIKSARQILDEILNQNMLKACNHFCYFSPQLNESDNDELQAKFRVVCFTETPIDQIDVLLNRVFGREFQPQPYGLVFTKDYIREKGGNPVFYVTKQIARPLQTLYKDIDISKTTCQVLALVSVCQKSNDWHWEREWRIVGGLTFKYSEIFCGLCPEGEIHYFEEKYPNVIFISPNWGIDKILSKLIGEIRRLSQLLSEPKDAPF